MALKTPLNISPVREDSMILLEHLLKHKPGTALEIGCGTGFITIELAKKGWKCTATDLCPKALKTSRENAESSSLDITFINTHLFEDVTGRFDAVLFNPPIIFSRNQLYPYLRGIVHQVPALNTVLESLLSSLPNKRRGKIIKRYLGEVVNHLTKEGWAFICLFDSELSSLPAIVTDWETVRVGNRTKIIKIEREWFRRDR